MRLPGEHADPGTSPGPSPEGKTEAAPPASRTATPERAVAPALEAGNASVHDLRAGRSPLARAGWMLLGLVFVAIGAVGVVIPGLPTTPFLVLAASCFVRSSAKLYEKLLANRIFGPPIRDFREGRGIPRRIKLMAIGTMWCFVAFAVLWAIPNERTWAQVSVLIAALIGTVYVYTLPNTEDFAPRDGEDRRKTSCR